MFGLIQKSMPKFSANKTVSRRFALAMALLAPTCPKAALTAEPLDAVVAGLIQRSEEQANLFDSGQMERWHEFVRLGENFTLMQPFGGPTSRGFNATPERLAELARNFRNGSATLEVAASYAADDLVVLVYIERQGGEVHGLPNQDWSLRVTQVFQHDGSDWRLVHRHADPLVRNISLERLSSLAKGE